MNKGQLVTRYIKHLADSADFKVSTFNNHRNGLIGNRVEMPNVSYTHPLWPSLKNQKTMRHFFILVLLTLTNRLYSQENLLIGNELGILEVKIETYKENISIYNYDGTIWMKFGFDYESKLRDKDSYTLDDIKALYNWNEDFNPYAFNLDNSLLMLICTAKEGDKYKVIVNKETGLEKYIINENIWILRNWQDHLVNSVVSIDFDSKSNPIRIKPNDESEIVKFGNDIDPVIDPIEIKEDWMKIKYWENEIEKTGWIKWKLDNKIILKLYYSI